MIVIRPNELVKLLDEFFKLDNVGYVIIIVLLRPKLRRFAIKTFCYALLRSLKSVQQPFDPQIEVIFAMVISHSRHISASTTNQATSCV